MHPSRSPAPAPAPRVRALAAGLALCGATATVAAETWDMPTPYPDKTFHTENIRQFADEVAAATDGALEIVVHSAGSLLPHAEIKNAVRGAQVPIGELFLSTLANEDAAYGVDSLPFVATSYDDAARLWQAQEPVVTELLAGQRLRPLFSVPWPPQGLYTDGEVPDASALEGLKFRTYNATLERFATLAGAVPTQVEAPDIPQAFATGQVEAMITSPSTGVSSKAWDFVSTYTPIDAWVPKNVVVVNAGRFDALAPEVREAVLEAAAAAEARGREMSEAETATQTAALEAGGMTVVEPSAELVEDLRALGDELLAEWEKDASDEARAILADYGR